MFLGFGSSSLGNRERRRAQNLAMSWQGGKVPVLGVREERKTLVQGVSVLKGHTAPKPQGCMSCDCVPRAIIPVREVFPSTGLRNSSADVISFLSNSSKH